MEREEIRRRISADWARSVKSGPEPPEVVARRIADECVKSIYTAGVLPESLFGITGRVPEDYEVRVGEVVASGDEATIVLELLPQQITARFVFS